MNLKNIYKYRYVFYIIVILAISIYLILLTHGYRINWSNFKMQKTSVIYVASIPQDVGVYVDSVLISDSTPLKISNVFPDKYDIKIENKEYEVWHKTLFVKENYVSQYQDIILILKDKKIISMEDREIKYYQSILSDENKIKERQKGLFIKENTEIIFQDVFITRFSKKINNLIWYTDNKHVLFQMGDEIVFMDIDGTNIISLVKLSSDDDVKFISSNEGKYLIYEDNNEIKKMQITNINSLFREKYFNRAVRIIK